MSREDEGAAKMASAGEVLEMSWGVARYEKRNQGRWAVQSGVVQWALRVALRERRKRSIIPFDCG